MTQEIKINITLTVEADIEQTTNDFENFVRNILTDGNLLASCPEKSGRLHV